MNQNFLTDILKEVTIHGKPYKLKPYSAKNRATVNERGVALQEQLANDEITEFQYYDELLQLICDGPYEWDVMADDFDGREAEDAFMSFFPPSMRVYMLLTGLQAS